MQAELQMERVDKERQKEVNETAPFLHQHLARTA